MMRDIRFVAEHRGGPLKKEQHYQLMSWAIQCSEHVIALYGDQIDLGLLTALTVAKGREKGGYPKASVAAHAIARKVSNPIQIAIARSIGQTVATAHMSDHSLGGAIYALKAVKFAGKSVVEERNRQNNQLPKEIADLVLSTRFQKEQGFKDLRL